MPRRTTVCNVVGCPEFAGRRGRSQAHARELERPWEHARTARGALRGGARTSWRQRALDRAGHACERCRRRPGDYDLEAHHLGPLDDHDNVVVLCLA